MNPGILLVVLLVVGATIVPAAKAAQLGIDPVSDIRLVAEQSEALCSWYQAGFRSMPLVQIAARPGIDSPRLDAPPTTEGLRSAFEHQPCENLRERTGFHLRQDALCDPDNFVLAAFRLGVVRELWWVIPSKQAVPAGEFDRFKGWLRVAFGLPSEFLDGLRHDGQEMRGTFRGLPVRLVTLSNLPAFAGPALVAIDAEYFVRIYENPVKEPMVGLLGGFFATLRDRKIEARGLTVSSSFANGRVPMAFAYLGGWLRDYLAAPDRFQQGPPEAWVTQSHIESLDFMLARDEALETAERLAGLQPASAQPWFFRAQVSANRLEPDEVKEFMAETVRRDPAYREGYIALAATFEERERRGEARAVLEAGCARFPDDLGLGLALIDFHLRQASFSAAATVAEGLGKRRPGYAEVAAVRAFALRAAGNATGAEEAMASFRAGAPEGGMRRSVLAAWEAQSAP